MVKLFSTKEDKRLTEFQQVVGEYHMSKGFEAYLEEYSDYAYLVLIKDSARNGIKRINKMGHDVYVG